MFFCPCIHDYSISFKSIRVEKIESFASKIKGKTVAISTYFCLNDVIESGLLAEHFLIGKNVGQKLHVCQRKRSGT